MLLLEFLLSWVFFSAKIGIFGDLLVIIMTMGTLSFLITTPECWVPNLGSDEYVFPLRLGAGRLVIKDTAIIAGAVVLLAQDANGYSIVSKSKNSK